MLKKILIGSLLVLLLGIIVVVAYDRSLSANANGQAYGQGWRGADYENNQFVESRDQQYGKRGSGQIGRAEDGRRYDQGNSDRAEDDHFTLPDAPNDEPLTEAEIQGLLRALDDEYHAWAVYGQVLVDFGQVRPFTNIQRAEAQHITTLVNLFDRYDVSVPDNSWVGNVESFDSVQAACAAGAEAEIANATLYDELFATTDRADILTVYQALQRASTEKHLPAFQRCAQ